ncbi:MAG: glycine oxidase ThiO [Acidobacteriota bacterium]
MSSHRPPPPQSLPSAGASRPSQGRGSQQPDVLILGGGIVGLACAWRLAVAGATVELLEKGQPGAAASAAAAGMLAPLGEVPETGPFFNACRASRDLWARWVRALEEESGVPIEYDTSGALMIALTESDEAALEVLRSAAEDLGEAWEPVSAGRLARAVPDLSPSARGALLLPGEHRVENRAVCRALAQACAWRGVSMVSDFEVERVRVHRDGVVVEGSKGRRAAPRMVVTAGAWSGTVRGLPALPVRPVKGQMVRLDGVRWPWDGIVSRHLPQIPGRQGGGLYAVRRGPHGLLVGATVEPQAEFDSRVTAGGLGRLLEGLIELFPGLANAEVERTWAGLRPSSPDGRPLIGPVDHGECLFAATGHYRNGILLAPWTAEQITTLLQGRPGAAELAAFTPSRFHG